MRQRARISAWAMDTSGKAHCDECGKEFSHPSQYRLIGDEVLCRNTKGCAQRKQERDERQANGHE